MKGLKQFGRELAAICRNKKVLIPVIAVLMIPVLYSAMFLGAFWDPYARLADLPVAIVNSDEGTELNGKTMNVGEEFVEQLKENKTFNWEFVTLDEVEAGFEDNKYYMALEIPADFSEKTASLTSESPEPAQLTFLPNESYNFLASQIGNTAVDQMKAMLNKEVTITYTRTVLEQIDTMAGGLGEASDGAGQIAEGSAAAKDGAVLIEQNLNKLVSGSLSLQEGVSQLNDGGKQLAAGSGDLNSGATTLASGLAQLEAAQGQLSGGAATLGAGAKEVGAGAVELSAGLKELAGAGGKLAASAGTAQQSAGQLSAGLAESAAGTAELQSGASQLARGLEALAQSNTALAQDANFKALLTASKQLEAGLTASSTAQQQLSGGAAQLNEGLTQIAAGLGTFDEKLQFAAASGEKLGAGGAQVAAGAESFTQGMAQFGEKLSEASAGGQKLAAGAQQLDSGAATLTAGLNQLYDKVGSFVDGSVQLEDGAAQVAQGLLKLNDGSQELSDKLSEAADKTTNLSVSDDQVEMFANPIEVDVEKVHEVPNYGTGFAPYFLSLGLFVGALLITIVYSVKEPIIRPDNGWSWFWSKALTLISIGTIQALIADAALLFILKLQVQSVPMFIMFSVLTSITFMMIIQFLVAVLGNPGRFIAIVILIFQLTSSAGTFPLELIPNWLQKVTPWMPMTYSVAGLKDVVSSGNYSSMWSNAGVLLLFAVIFAGLSLAYFTFVHRNTLKTDGIKPVASAS